MCREHGVFFFVNKSTAYLCTSQKKNKVNERLCVMTSGLNKVIDTMFV